MAKMRFSLVFVVLVALHMGSNPVDGSPKDGDVLFDSSYLDLEELEMPGPCQGQSYCFEEGDNYPKEKIEILIEDMREWKMDNPASLLPQNIIDSRKGDTYDEPECLTDSTERPIFYIIDKQEKLRVVVQSKKFQQIYSVKWCRDEGRITRDTPHFLKNSKILQKFECVTTKMDFDFFVLSDEVDPVSQKPKMEIASAKGGIPVCCRCRYNVDD